jgi:hypothetical protein
MAPVGPTTTDGQTNNNFVFAPPGLNYPAKDKASILQSIIEQLNTLDQQAQVSVLRAVAAYFEIEEDLSR